MTADAASTPENSDHPTKTRRRGWRVLWWVLGALGALLVVGVVALLIYSQVGLFTAESEPVAAVKADTDIVIEETDAAIVLSPASGESAVGLVYIPGAKVDAWAYASKLSDIVTEDDVTVVITKPWLNLAFFDFRPLSAFTDLVPGVDTWIVGGHSLGGVKACMLAEDADALALFASYCANDLTASGLPVLSLSGSEDGLSTPEKIRDAAPLLPADAEFTEIAGASHSSFGDYGLQPGDGTPTISDPDMTAALTDALGAFAATLAP